MILLNTYKDAKMTEAKDLVIMPLGTEAGQPVKLADALTIVATEMMSHRSDFLAMANNRIRSDIERGFYRRRAVDLERYATAINAIALQLEPERWQDDYSGLLELARQNGITLPDWMTKDE
jgi:hypothetical protein